MSAEFELKLAEEHIAILRESIAQLKAQVEAYKQFVENVSRANVLASTYGYLNRNISDALVALGDTLLESESEG